MRPLVPSCGQRPWPALRPTRLAPPNRHAPDAPDPPHPGARQAPPAFGSRLISAPRGAPRSFGVMLPESEHRVDNGPPATCSTPHCGLRLFFESLTSAIPDSKPEAATLQSHLGLPCLHQHFRHDQLVTCRLANATVNSILQNRIICRLCIRLCIQYEHESEREHICTDGTRQYEQSIVKGQVWPDPVFFGAWPYHLACFASSMDVSRPTRVFAV